MKLLYCNRCFDVIQLVKTTRTCQCGASGGHYKEDGLNAIIHGDCKPLGFVNYSFRIALENQPEHGAGYKFTSFAIPKNCPTVKRVNSEDYELVGEQLGWSDLDEEHESTMEQADADRISKSKIKNVFRDEE